MARGFTPFVRVAKLIIDAEERITAAQIASLTGISQRTVYRYVKAFKSYDPRVKAEAGMGIRYNRNQRI